MERFEPAFHRTRSQSGEGPYRTSDTLEVFGSKVLKLKQIAKQLSRAIGDDDCVWLCNALQACRQVRRFANDCLLLCGTRSNQIAHNDQPSSNTDTGLKGCVRFQVPYGRDQLQPCPNGSLSVVLMCLRVTEVSKHAVAHVIGDKATEAAHG